MSFYNQNNISGEIENENKNQKKKFIKLYSISVYFEYMLCGFIVSHRPQAHVETHGRNIF